MGGLMGHAAPGIGFFGLGLWHMINHIRRHCQNPLTYTSDPWFPSPVLSRYLELYLIMVGCFMCILFDLFIGQKNHQPLDPSDWTIPSSHTHNFEHGSIFLTFFLYALFSLLLDKLLNTNKGKSPSSSSMANSMGKEFAAVAFSQQLLMIHLHSTDDTGLEGHYHWLLQLVIGVSLVTTLMGIGYDNSFVVSFVRSTSIMFQGVWIFLIGILLWTPEFNPKGCFTTIAVRGMVVRCHDDESLHRAKSLVNIGFSWCFIAVTTLAMLVYMVMQRSWSDLPEYSPLKNPTSAFYSFASSEDEELGLRRCVGISRSIWKDKIMTIMTVVILNKCPCSDRFTCSLTSLFLLVVYYVRWNHTNMVKLNRFLLS